MLKSFTEDGEDYYYETITQQFFIENHEVLTTGLIAYKAGCKGDIASDDFCLIEDISTDSNIVESIINFLCSFKVFPIHAKDVVQDWLNDNSLLLR